MGSVIKEIRIDASPEKVWAAISDFAEGPLRLGPGVFTDCTLWLGGGSAAPHDNTSMQVFADGEARSRLVWIHDTLPDELTGWLSAAMDQIAPVFQQVLAS
jgi:uncharacterized protein YndB with AHSA1/START domain